MNGQNLRSRKLNGWFRLWLLASAIWFVAVVALKAEGYPTEDGLRKVVTERSFEIRRELRDKAKAIFENCREQSVKASNEDISMLRCLKTPGENYQSISESANSEMYRTQELGETYIQENLPTLQREYVGSAVALWGIPVVVVCLLGYAVAWVIRGFRPTPREQL